METVRQQRRPVKDTLSSWQENKRFVSRKALPASFPDSNTPRLQSSKSGEATFEKPHSETAAKRGARMPLPWAAGKAGLPSGGVLTLPLLEKGRENQVEGQRTRRSAGDWPKETDCGRQNCVTKSRRSIDSAVSLSAVTLEGRGKKLFQNQVHLRHN